MKINEAKFRSPKWLRNFVDYEINTGEDIKGEPSKRKAARLEKEKQAELKRQAEKRERDRQIQEELRREQQAREDVRKKQEQQANIEKELNKLYYSIISDFSSARYLDKIITPQINGKNAFHYIFEDGRYMKMYSGKKSAIIHGVTYNKYELEWENSLYTLGLNWSGKFIDLANEMIKKAGTRPRSSSRQQQQQSYSGSQQQQQQRKANNTPPKWRDHPKGGMYQTLKDTVKLREDQLKKATGSDKEALQNELNAAKRMLDNLNKKYNFESNIQNFVQFNQIFEKSRFVDKEEFDELLDKIADSGITSLTDIEKKRLDLFSMDDEPILDLIDKMGDLTAEFKIINKKIKQLSDDGKSVEAKNLFRDEWGPLNDEMSKFEKEIRSYGIEVGDETFTSMMNKHRSDVYGYDFDKDGDDKLEMDI